MRTQFAKVALVVLVASAVVYFPVPRVASAANLILNPSLETANAAGTAPVNWLSNKWGTNIATFTYPVAGSDGAKGAKVTMTAWTNGDAKWYFADVNVTPGQLYTYQNYYKASVATEVVVRYQSTTGTFTYNTIATPAASASNWQAVNATFTPPAGTKSVTVFHVIHAVGTLEVDNYSLSTGTTPPPPDPTPTPSPGSNLILNPSAETANGAAPANWSSNKWGTNTAVFSYETTGRTGSRSLKTTVSGYTSGDAKWYNSSVDVESNVDYTFSNWYKSTIPTHVVLVSFNASNQPTYTDLGINVPASASTWKDFTANFKTSATTKKVAIYHVIEGNGSLTVDDYSLVKVGTTPTPPPPGTNSVPNPSLEQASGALPTSWSTETWGTNTPTFEYVNEGHTGSKSVKVTVANYVSGDSKWMFAPQTLTPGADYKLNAWYKTNTTPRVVARYIKSDGSESYLGLRNPQPNGSANWQEYNDVFTVPIGTQSVTVFFFLTNNGWVQTDDYSITPYTYPALNRGLVTLTFDDGLEQNITTALPVLNQYGFKTTQCNATQFVEGIPAQVQNVQTYVNSGHEICSHSVTHPSLITLNATQLTYELTHSKSFLQSITGQSISNFASPFGEYNAAVNTEIAKYYTSHRTTDEGYNSKDMFDPYRLKVQNLEANTTLAEFQSWVNKAKQDKTWLILVYHVVNTTNTLDAFDTKKADFDAQMAWLSTTGVTVQRWDQSLAEVKAQLP